MYIKITTRSIPAITPAIIPASELYCNDEESVISNTVVVVPLIVVEVSSIVVSDVVNTPPYPSIRLLESADDLSVSVEVVATTMAVSGIELGTMVVVATVCEATWYNTANNVIKNAIDFIFSFFVCNG